MYGRDVGFGVYSHGSGQNLMPLHAGIHTEFWHGRGEIKCMLGGGGGGAILMKSLTFLNKRTGKSDCRLYSCVRIILILGILGVYVGDLTFGGGGGGGGGGYPPFPPSV